MASQKSNYMTSHCTDFESACGSFLSLLDNRYEEFLVIINQSKVVIFRAWARAWSCNIFVPWWFMIWPLNLVAGPKLTPQERCPVMVKKEKKETLSPWRVEMSIWRWTKKKQKKNFRGEPAQGLEHFSTFKSYMLYPFTSTPQFIN